MIDNRDENLYAVQNNNNISGVENMISGNDNVNHLEYDADKNSMQGNHEDEFVAREEFQNTLSSPRRTSNFSEPAWRQNRAPWSEPAFQTPNQ